MSKRKKRPARTMPEEYQRSLRHTIEELRKIYGSDRAIANAAGYSNSAISNVMSGKSTGSMDMLERLRKMLGKAPAEQHVKALHQPGRPLRDLPSFERALSEARQIAPQYTEDIWIEAGEIRQVQGQTEVTTMTLLRAAEYVASGKPTPPQRKRHR